MTILHLEVATVAEKYKVSVGSFKRKDDGSFFD
jgi:hypothetical protein